METQPTQHGLMQLFMSLGLSTDTSLTTLGSGAEADATGFDSLLAGYLPDSNMPDPSLTAVSITTEESLTSPLMGLNDSEQAIDLTDSSLMAVGALPLLQPETGEDLPLSPLASPLLAQDSVTLKTDGVKAKVETPHDDAGQALLEDQGFYAQSLVSSMMNTANMNESGKAGVNSDNQQMRALQASMTGSAEQGSTVSALASLQAAVAVNNKALPGAVATDSSELGADDSLNIDRFLGADTKKPGSLSFSTSLTSSLATSSTLSPSLTQTQPMALAESNVSLALAMSEDPINQSLQDLTATEDIEKSVVEAKITTTERKQDDQVLRLNKGQQAWGDAISERISMNAAQNIKQVTIHLDPPELGSLELKLQIKDDQQTQVQVQVQNPQVKEALESSAHRLRDMLASEGLELAEFDVQTGAEQKGQDGEQDAQQSLAQEQQNSDTSFIEGEESLDISLPKNNNLLDTFV